MDLVIGPAHALNLLLRCLATKMIIFKEYKNIKFGLAGPQTLEVTILLIIIMCIVYLKGRDILPN